jgi:hypothetical protein
MSGNLFLFKYPTSVYTIQGYIQPVNTPPNNSASMTPATANYHTSTTTLNLRLKPSATPYNGAVSRSAALYT